MDRESLKVEAARAALAYVEPDSVIGVGAGSTVERFVEVLGDAEVKPRAVVAGSERTRLLLEAQGIPVVGLSENILPLPLCIDGADEVDSELRLIKGGGGALTREKILATASARFVCIVDETKLVPRLGAFPLAVEVVQWAVPFVQRELRALGGESTIRLNFESDSSGPSVPPGAGRRTASKRLAHVIERLGNVILDVRGLDFTDPLALEQAIQAIPGVVECGVFARRRADIVLVGTQGGVRKIERPLE